MTKRKWEELSREEQEAERYRIKQQFKYALDLMEISKRILKGLSEDNSHDHKYFKEGRRSLDHAISDIGISLEPFC